MSDLVKRLRDSSNDPMWADYAEISKTVLTRAVDRIEQLEKENKEWRMIVENLESQIRGMRSDAALDQSSPPVRQENDDVFPGFRGNNDSA